VALHDSALRLHKAVVEIQGTMAAMVGSAPSFAGTQLTARRSVGRTAAPRAARIVARTMEAGEWCAWRHRLAQVQQTTTSLLSVCLAGVGIWGTKAGMMQVRWQTLGRRRLEPPPSGG
jgi:hypothetical protein